MTCENCERLAREIDTIRRIQEFVEEGSRVDELCCAALRSKPATFHSRLPREPLHMPIELAQIILGRGLANIDEDSLTRCLTAAMDRYRLMVDWIEKRQREDARRDASPAQGLAP